MSAFHSREYLAMNPAVSSDHAHSAVDVMLGQLNCTLAYLHRTFLVEDLIDSCKVWSKTAIIYFYSHVRCDCSSCLNNSYPDFLSCLYSSCPSCHPSIFTPTIMLTGRFFAMREVSHMMNHRLRYDTQPRDLFLQDVSKSAFRHWLRWLSFFSSTSSGKLTALVSLAHISHHSSLYIQVGGAVMPG